MVLLFITLFILHIIFLKYIVEMYN